MVHMDRMQHLFTSCSKLQLLMVVVVVAAPLLVLATKSSSPDPHLRKISFYHLPLDDSLFTKDVLQDVWARSRIDCSKKCVETEGCVMCTFHSSPEGPSPGLCRLHSQLHKNTDVKQSRPGARSVARRGPCEGDYVSACDRCLKVAKDNVYYHIAKQRCSDSQGQLVMPKTVTEAVCVGHFGNERGLRFIWIGADDIQTPGVFKWSDGTLLNKSDLAWAEGEPNSSNPGDACVSMGTVSLNFYDTSGWLPSQIMCQRNKM